MYKITGLQTTSFLTKDEKRINGTTIFLSYALDKKRGGQGFGAEKYFLSTAKESLLDFKLELGIFVELFFNRFGKIALHIPAHPDGDSGIIRTVNR